MSTIQRMVQLWDAINGYAVSCGGDPSRRVYGNTTRQRYVAEVDKIVRETAIEHAAKLESDRAMLVKALRDQLEWIKGSERSNLLKALRAVGEEP